MKQQSNAKLLRIYIGEQDRWHGEPLYAAIVAHLHELQIAGVTVMHGIEGFGAEGKLHTIRFENLFQGLPIVIEAVDSSERIAVAAAALDEMVTDGLVTIQDLTAIHYTREPKA